MAVPVPVVPVVPVVAAVTTVVAVVPVQVLPPVVPPVRAAVSAAVPAVVVAAVAVPVSAVARPVRSVVPAEPRSVAASRSGRNVPSTRTCRRLSSVASGCHTATARSSGLPAARR